MSCVAEVRVELITKTGVVRAALWCSSSDVVLPALAASMTCRALKTGESSGKTRLSSCLANAKDNRSAPLPLPLGLPLG